MEMNEHQSTCKGEDGELLYPWLWYCGICRNSYCSQSIAKYCCSDKLSLWCSEHGEQEGNVCKECLKKVK